jgi:hypothetical protein
MKGEIFIEINGGTLCKSDGLNACYKYQMRHSGLEGSISLRPPHEYEIKVHRRVLE